LPSPPKQLGGVVPHLSSGRNRATTQTRTDLMKLFLTTMMVSTATLFLFGCGVIAHACWKIIEEYEQADF
jgi:hypothetical protein